MIVTKAIKKFERLERLCPFLKLDKEERICKTLEMFYCNIAIFVATSRQPTTMAKCYERALRAKSRLNQLKEEKLGGVKLGKGKKEPNSETAINPRSSKKGQGTKKTAKLSNLGSQKMRSRKRS